MNKKPVFERVGDFMAGKGFYIVLVLCVAAIGISGYYLFTSLNLGAEQGTAVSKPVTVVVTPAPKPAPVTPFVPPSQKPVPTPKQQPTPTPAAPAPRPRKAAKTIYTWPVKGDVVGDFSLEVFGYDEILGDYRVHAAMDIAADLGTQVKAVSGGMVSDLSSDDLLGTMLTLDHGSGLVSVYANLAALPTVEIGDKVSTGDVIGAVGETAIVETDKASHLHFAMYQDGEAVDPANYLPK